MEQGKEWGKREEKEGPVERTVEGRDAVQLDQKAQTLAEDRLSSDSLKGPEAPFLSPEPFLPRFLILSIAMWTVCLPSSQEICADCILQCLFYQTLYS